MFSKLKAIWNGLPEGVKRVVHTAWQSICAFVVYAVYVKHVPLHSVSDVQALAFGAIGAAFAAVRVAVLAAIAGRRS